MSTVKVVMKRGATSVVNISTRNANEAWVILQSTEEVTRGGRIFRNQRTGFLRSTKDILVGKGFKEGQELPGRIVIQDSVVPIVPGNEEFGLRVPQSRNGITYTPAIGEAIRTACNKAGIVYMSNEQPLYRKTFYSPYPEGHAMYEADNIITPDNLDEVNAFVAKIVLPSTKPSTGMDSAKAARLAELKALVNPNRKEKAEIASIEAELED